MINFKDAVPPAGKGNVRKIDGAEKTIEYPDGWENSTKPRQSHGYTGIWRV